MTTPHDRGSPFGQTAFLRQLDIPVDTRTIVYDEFVQDNKVISKLNILTDTQLSNRMKFAQKMSEFHEDVGWYMTWDNGFRPFLVIITPIFNSDKLCVTAYRPSPNRVYTDDEGDYVEPETREYTHMVVRYEAQRVFLGKDIPDKADTIGNSILVNISEAENTYAFIGTCIYEFTSPETIDKLWSPVKGSDCPYPCASTKKRVYVFVEITGSQNSEGIKTILWTTIRRKMPKVRKHLRNFYDEYYEYEYYEKNKKKIICYVNCVMKHMRTIYQ